MKIIAKILLLFSFLITCLFVATTQETNRNKEAFNAHEIKSKALIREKLKLFELNKQQKDLLIGWAKSEITPPIGTATLGYGDRIGKGAYQSDGPLFARAIAFQTETNTPVVMLTADLCFWPNRLSQQLSLRVNDILPRDHIFFGATHTHEGPGSIIDAPLLELIFGSYSEEVVEIILNGAESAVRQAIYNLNEGSVRVHSIAIPELTKNRTYSDLSISQTAVVIELKKNTGDKALINTYPAHATIIAPHPVVSSANYPGALNADIESSGWQLSAFFAAETAQAGPSLNNLLIQEPGFEVAQTYGKLLSEKIQQNIKNTEIEFENKVHIQVLRSEISLPDWGFRLPFLDRSLRPNVTKALLNGQDPDAHIHGFAINRLLLIGHGFELSAEHGYRARKIADNKNITLVPLSFNGEHHFYVVPETSFDLPGYEPTMAFFGPHLAAYLDRLNLFLLEIFFPDNE